MHVDRNEVVDRFAYHDLNGGQRERVQATRDAFVQVVTVVLETTRPSREQSLALTKLEEAQMFAIKAISRENG